MSQTISQIRPLYLTALWFVLSLAVAALPRPAHASREDITSIGAIQQGLREDAPKAKMVRIEGALSCDLGAANNGQACELKLHEATTGKTYNLIQARSAMMLYQDGKRHVAIEGHLAGPETLEVRDAQKL